MKSWAQSFTELLVYVGIHQLRMMVFDNYQACLEPLSKLPYIYDYYITLCVGFQYSLRATQTGNNNNLQTESWYKVQHSPYNKPT